MRLFERTASPSSLRGIVVAFGVALLAVACSSTDNEGIIDASVTLEDGGHGGTHDATHASDTGKDSSKGTHDSGVDGQTTDGASEGSASACSPECPIGAVCSSGST